MSSTVRDELYDGPVKMFPRFEKLRADAVLPKRMTEHSAAFDLYAAEDAYINSEYRSHMLVGTGVRVNLRPGETALVCSRSGLALKEGVFVLNAPGIIDPDYSGEIKVIMATYRPNTMFNIKPGDRIAQLLIVRHCQADNFLAYENYADAYGRGANGFGSSGV